MERIKRALKEHQSFLGLVIRRRDLLVPMMSIWVASFGGGEHASVTTYYLQEVGTTTKQMGDFGMIKTVGVVILSPFYGWLMDHRSAFLPIVLSSFCCSFGCLIRGLVPVGFTAGLYASHVVLGLGALNFWGVVGSYIAMATPRDIRPLAVASYEVQVSTLKLVGTCSFPFFDNMLIALGIEELLLRYRIHMSICSLFCVFGLVAMLLAFRPVAVKHELPEEKVEEKVDAHKVDTFQLCILLASLVIQAFGETVVLVLWPLHIQKLGWASHEYAYLEIASKLLVIGGSLAYPATVRSLGYRFTASGLPVAACMTSAGAFLHLDTTLYGQAVHVINALAFLSACGVMKVCYQHLTTLAVPHRLQGRIFALMQTLVAVGSIAGNWFGTRLWEHETSMTSKGTLPFLMASSMFMLAGCLIAGLLAMPPPCGPMPVTHIAEEGPED